MAQFFLRHPSDPRLTASYGWDAAISFFVELRRCARVVATYDVFSSHFDVEHQLEGALRFLVAAGFFSDDDIATALFQGQTMLCEHMEEPVRRAAEVFANFRRDAD